MDEVKSGRGRGGRGRGGGGRGRGGANGGSAAAPAHIVKFTVGLADIDISDFDDDMEVRSESTPKATTGVLVCHSLATLVGTRKQDTHANCSNARERTTETRMRTHRPLFRPVLPRPVPPRPTVLDRRYAIHS